MRAAAWIASRLGRAVLAVAVAALLLGIGLAALGVAVSTWPVRQIRGPSRRRAQIEAALQLAQAAAALAATIREPSAPSARDASRVDRGHASSTEP